MFVLMFVFDLFVHRMNSNSLAIVFSPCIVRSTRSLPVHESLSEVSKLTQVIERVISRRLIDFRTTLAQIDSVDSKTADAGAKLDLIRQVINFVLIFRRHFWSKIYFRRYFDQLKYKIAFKSMNLGDKFFSRVLYYTVNFFLLLLCRNGGLLKICNQNFTTFTLYYLPDRLFSFMSNI